MKALLVTIVSALAGAIAGVGMTWASFRDPPTGLLPPAIDAPAAQTAGPRPELALDQMTHDFGYVERDTKVWHTFKITNIGQGTLTLKDGGTTCTACTIAALSKETLAPGESADITVQYEVNPQKAKFHQIASLLTNDPKRPRVELEIMGLVTSRFSVSPSDVAFTSISAREPATAEIKVSTNVSDRLTIAAAEMGNPETAGHFELKSELMTPEQLLAEKAKAGSKLSVTLKPGLPLGPIRQTIRLTIDTGPGTQPGSLVIPVEGSVVSDLSIVGPKWNSDQGVLSIGSVQGSVGAKRELRILVRGDARRDVRVEPAEVTPSWMKVQVGEAAELSPSVMQIPFSIEIPPGSPPGIHLGTGQGAYGEVVLRVAGHPDVKEMRMLLKFLVE